MTRLGKEENIEMNYKDFLRGFLPSKNSSLWTSALRKGSTVAAVMKKYESESEAAIAASSAEREGDEKLQVDVEYALARVVARELEMHRKIENIKKHLHEEDRLDLVGSFRYLEGKTQRSFFKEHHLLRFLRGCGLDAIEDDIKAIFRRMDRNNDGRIKKKEYALTIMPLHTDKANVIAQLEEEDMRRELNTEEEEE